MKYSHLILDCLAKYNEKEEWVNSLFLFEMKQETEDLEQTRTNFAEHLEKIDRLNPESWTRDNLKNECKQSLQKSL